MSAQHLVFNNLGSTLTNAITSGQTSFDVDDPVFTSPGADFYTVTAENISTGSVEIMKVIGVTGNTLTVERGFEGTSPAAFDAGNPVQVRTTAGLLNRLGQKSDLGTAYAFQTTVVTGLLNLYVDPAGSDSTGDGSVGNPWATPYKAVEELQYIRFGVTGSAVVNFAAGTYNMDAQLVCNHPQGYRITFTSPATFQPITGVPIADYSVNRNAPTVPGRGANEFHNTAGTVGANVSDATRDTNRANDWANNLSLFRSLNGCIFEWGSAGADEAKFLIITSLGGLSNICFLFPTPTPGLVDARNGIQVSPGATLQASELQIYGGQNGLDVNEGQVRCTNIAVTGSRVSIYLNNAGVLDCDTVVCQGGDSSSLVNISNSVLTTSSTVTVTGAKNSGALLGTGATWRSGDEEHTFSGNGASGLDVTDNANILDFGSSKIISTGNFQDGINLLRNAVCTVNGADCIGNNGYGLRARLQSTHKGYGGTVTLNNNGSRGLDLAEGGILSVPVVIVSGNDLEGMLVTTAGAVLVEAATIQNNGGAAVLLSYAGPCRLLSLVVDTTNGASPHMSAVGGTVARCPAPGASGVANDVVFYPTHNTLGISGQIFTDEA